MIPEPHVKAIVKETVKETFLTLGIDVTDPENLLLYQQDMHYLRTTRVRREALESKFWLHFFGLGLSAIGAAIILAITGHRIPLGE